MHLFYQPQLMSGIHSLTDEEFHHCVKVLRHVEGDEIHVTDGLGTFGPARITQIRKKELDFTLRDTHYQEPDPFGVHLYIAPTKQQERMEWMVEKLCEIGIGAITFIQTANSERAKIRLDRLEKKSLSALKQSKGSWITQINPMIDFEIALSQSRGAQKLLAAVTDDSLHYGSVIQKGYSTDIFIGPEGDFTIEEVNLTKKKGVKTVSLGPKILRTETAGLLASYYVHTMNQF